MLKMLKHEHLRTLIILLLASEMSNCTQLKTCTQTLPLPKLDPPLLIPRTVQYSLHPENEGMCMTIAQQAILHREAEEFILSMKNPNRQI